MNVRPLRDRVLVKRVEAQEQRIGGIIIPDTAKEKPQQAQVIAAGNGRVNEESKTIPLDVEVGDYVLIGKYSGTEIKLDGEEYLIVREDEILGIGWRHQASSQAFGMNCWRGTTPGRNRLTEFLGHLKTRNGPTRKSETVSPYQTSSSSGLAVLSPLQSLASLKLGLKA